MNFTNKVTITSITPTHGPGGANDTIDGTGFNASILLDTVLINGKTATVLSAGSTQLIVTVPSLAGSGTVKVTTGSTTASGPNFDYDTTYISKVFASGLNNPQFIALDSSGNFFVTNFGDGTVSKITANGTVTTFATGLGLPQGIAVDGKGNLYVAGNLPFDRSFRLLLSGDR